MAVVEPLIYKHLCIYQDIWLDLGCIKNKSYSITVIQAKIAVQQMQLHYSVV